MQKTLPSSVLSRLIRVFRKFSRKARRACSFRVSLHTNELWRMEVSSGPVPVECLQGEVWITAEGSGDILLSKGKRCDIHGSGLILVGAISDAQLCITAG